MRLPLLRCLLTTAAAAVAIPFALTAQAVGGGATACVIDSIRALRLDTLTFMLGVAPGTSKRDSAAARQLAEQIGASYAHPSGKPLTLDGWTGALTEEQVTGQASKKVPIAGHNQGRLRIAFTPSGAIGSIKLTDPSQSPTVDDAIVAAVYRADSAAPFSNIPGVAGRTFQLRVFHTYAGTTEAGAPFFHVDVSYLLISEPARLAKLSMPRSPEWAGSQEMQAYVDLQFVVGTDGGAESASLKVVGGSEVLSQEFLESARESALSGTFVPATVQGCAVRQLLRQRIRYSP